MNESCRPRDIERRGGLQRARGALGVPLALMLALGTAMCAGDPDEANPTESDDGSGLVPSGTPSVTSSGPVGSMPGTVQPSPTTSASGTTPSGIGTPSPSGSPSPSATPLPPQPTPPSTNAGGASGGGGSGGAPTLPSGSDQPGGGGNPANTGGAGDGGRAGDASGGVGAGGDASGGDSSGGAGGADGEPNDGFDPCPPTGPCKIMPFGDSITEGCCNFNGGYRVPLFRLARAAGQEITFVGSVSNGPERVDDVPFPRDHEGHGGFTIEGNNGIARFVMPSMTAYQPNIITLMIGTNDINGNVDLQGAPRRLKALLDSIYAIDPDVLVVLAQIVPTRNDGTNQRIQSYNSAFPELVAEQVAAGRHLILVDMYEAFTRDGDYRQTLLADDLHPGNAGFVRMGEVWYEAIRPFLR